jgi:hypothetical protein
MTRQELVQKAKEMGIVKPQNMKTAVLEEMVNATPTVQTVSTSRRGRPVNTSSARQQRLVKMEERRQQGTFRRGRPVNENSQRQQRIQKRESGLVRRGRPAKVATSN